MDLNGLSRIIGSLALPVKATDLFMVPAVVPSARAQWREDFAPARNRSAIKQRLRFLVISHSESQRLIGIIKSSK
jgi:hypothetical protein